MSHCDVCCRVFKTERGLRVHLRRSSHSHMSPVDMNMFPCLPEFVLLENVFSFLDATSICNLIVSCKCMLKVCTINHNNYWWRRALSRYGLYTSQRTLPEYADKPGIAFLRLTPMHKKKSCFSCQFPTSSINQFYRIPLCGDCQRHKDQYRCVTRTTAMRDYCLKSKEVDKLEYVSAPNPYYRSAAPMKLYLLSDVVHVQGSRDVDAIQQKKIESTEKRRNTIAGKQEVRRNELVNALEMLGLVLRSDSELCDKYIKGSRDAWSLNALVDEMAFMKYLHEYTDYETRLEKEVKHIADYNGYYNGIWREAAEYTKQRYTRPTVWPWIIS
jgi:hypothetical protein